MTTNPAKAEALRALEHLRARLADGAPLEGLERSQLRATAEYAIEQVGAIAELKRARRVPHKEEAGQVGRA